MFTHPSWDNPDTISSMLEKAEYHWELNELYLEVLNRILQLEEVPYNRKVQLISHAKALVNKIRADIAS